EKQVSSLLCSYLYHWHYIVMAYNPFKGILRYPDVLCGIYVLQILPIHINIHFSCLLSWMGHVWPVISFRLWGFFTMSPLLTATRYFSPFSKEMSTRRCVMTPSKTTA